MKKFCGKNEATHNLVNSVFYALCHNNQILKQENNEFKINSLGHTLYQTTMTMLDQPEYVCNMQKNMMETNGLAPTFNRRLIIGYCPLPYY